MTWELAYSTSTTSPLTFIALPGAPRFGADIISEESDIVQETNLGARWVYRLFERQVWRLTIRLSITDLVPWRDMHATVGGQANPFYFRMGTEILYCRKEAGFAPKMLTEPTQPIVFDYTITLTEEKTVAAF